MKTEQNCFLLTVLCQLTAESFFFQRNASHKMNITSDEQFHSAIKKERKMI